MEMFKNILGKVYAHFVVALFFFVVMDQLAVLVTSYMPWATFTLRFEDKKAIYSTILLGILFFPILKKQFPFMKYWIPLYAIGMFFVRFLYF